MDQPFVQAAVRSVGQRPLPEWIEVDRTAMTGTVLRNPQAADIDTRIETRMIVEFYSR
jgi:small subunit ribosomal protein S4